MFCTQKIELCAVTTDVPVDLIPREMLVDYTHAQPLLEQAQAHVQALIRQAESQCERMLENAGQQFWQQANTQLQRWESERQAMHDQLEQVATAVINTALRSFLDETPPAQRLTALLNQLLDAQMPPVEATLRCHPQDREPIEQCLAQLREVPWKLKVDHDCTAQSLMLETEDGGFHINWASALEHLILPDSR